MACKQRNPTPASQSPDPFNPGFYRVRIFRRTPPGGLTGRWITVNRKPLTQEQAISACARIVAGQSISRALRMARKD